MSRQTLYDVPGGDTILYDIVDEANGYRQPTYLLSEEERFRHFNNIKNFKCRRDDILLVSYPKTGTQWLWDMLTLMLSRSSEVGGEGKFSCMLEAIPAEILDSMSSPRILNTHVKVRYLPEEAVEKKLKTILLVRNPKDVAVSFYNHTKGLQMYKYQGKFENYLKMFMRGEVDYGSYPDYLKEWQDYVGSNLDLPFHVVYYKDLHWDCIEELGRLKDFLELDVDDNLIKAIADNCSFYKLQEKKHKAMTPDRAAHLKRMLKPEFNPFRKGQIGDWKNWFTISQSEKFDTWWSENTQGLEMFNPFQTTPF